MRDIIVAVDLETTGFDPEYDRIIEIGAVKFQGERVLDEWHTLIDPGRPIPPYITQLTGIADRDVRSAPTLREVLPALQRFIGSAILLGHNIHFDLGFLRSAGLALSNPLIDTYLVASVMMPSAARYSLLAVAMALGIAPGNAHRALDDSRMAMAVFHSLWQRALALPLSTLREIVRLGRQMPWDAHLFFEGALRERLHGQTAAAPNNQAELQAGVPLFFISDAPAAEGPALQAHPKLIPINVDRVAGLIEPGGQLAEVFEGYEYRSQQVEMLRHVARALNEGQHMLIEAPTGVGKSLAYLLPAAHFAMANNTRVVISTNTINLQEQLIHKDIPLLQERLGLPVRAAVLKGRSNYLCPRRLAALRRRGPTSREEMHMLAKILVWLTANPSGDRSDLSLRGPAEASIWRRLSAEDEGCTLERCATQMGGACPFYQARRRAENAHLLIVNHALLLSDAVTEGRVLPEFSYLIVDEAHHLEDAVTNSLSFRTDPDTILRQIAELGTPRSGLLGDLLHQTHGSIPPNYHEALADYIQTVADASSQMARHVERFFEVLRHFLEDHARLTHNAYAQQIRILPTLRNQPGWSQVEIAWDNLGQFTSAIAEAMVKIAQALTQLQDYDIEGYDDLLAAIGAAARHLSELHLRLNEIVLQPAPNMVYWVEFQPDGVHISLHAAPLDVGPLVQKHLWHAKDAVIMTSATLRAGGSFDFIRERLDADDVEEIAIETPFDYKNNALLYIVEDIPEPTEQDQYQQAVEQGILNLCRATEGRAMILFTSYAQLRATVNAIGDALAREGIVVYDQSDGSSRTQLLEGFIQSEKAVLMGTRSFWEGVDVPGPDLSVLVIVRLPFSVPTDPLFAARSELLEDSFQQYALPETILRFRQGFGRLIRRKTDRGVVVILDRRVISKAYGRQFLDSLPECTVRQGSLADLPAVARAWLSGETSGFAQAPF